MKSIVLFAFAMLVVSPVMMAKKKAPVAAPAEEIHWITSIDELQAKMHQNPKKVYVDVYTNWCGWCKKMEATTFQNQDVVKYINLNFYAVRLDAERQDVINFMGKQYQFEPDKKMNGFAYELLKNSPGGISYPTSVILLENFQNPTPVSGYMTVPQLETVLVFFGDNTYRHVQWPEHQKTYKPRWDKGAAPDMTPPPGH
jgi:thioredoxin-related protein